MSNSIYKRKMSSTELQEHLNMCSRARQFKDKKKEASRTKCRKKVSF